MIWSLRGSVLGVLLQFICVGVTSAGAVQTPSGVDLFIEACRWQGNNPSMIRTGRAKFEQVVTTSASREQLQGEVVRTVENQRQLLQTQTDPKIRAVLERGIRELPGVITDRLAVPQRSRIEVLFAGNERATGRRRWEVSAFSPMLKDWERPIVGLCRDYARSDGESVIWYSQGSTATVGEEKHGVDDFQTFGRIQGTPLILATAALLRGSDPARFEFQPERVAEFKAKMAQITRTGKLDVLALVREISYDNGALAYVIETRALIANGKPQLLQRYWIDASRGYVCPKTQICDSRGYIAQEWESRDYFLHEGSGLWFPQYHSYKEYNPGTEQLHVRREYYIDKASLQLNQTVSDKEFAIDLPVGTSVIETRGSSPRHFRAKKTVTLGFVPGGLDLGSKPGLIEEPNAVQPFLRAFSGRTALLIVINVVIALFIAALIFFGTRRRARR